MPSRRLEDRIRELCARVVCENDPHWEEAVHELQRASHEHSLRLDNMTTAAVAIGKPEVFVERRHG